MNTQRPRMCLNSNRKTINYCGPGRTGKFDYVDDVSPWKRLRETFSGKSPIAIKKAEAKIPQTQRACYFEPSDHGDDCRQVESEEDCRFRTQLEVDAEISSRMDILREPKLSSTSLDKMSDVIREVDRDSQGGGIRGVDSLPQPQKTEVPKNEEGLGWTVLRTVLGYDSCLCNLKPMLLVLLGVSTILLVTILNLQFSTIMGYIKTEKPTDQIPAKPHQKYIHFFLFSTLGEKVNIACRYFWDQLGSKIVQSCSHLIP